jgi:P-type conjugative transfer protein TrbG
MMGRLHSARPRRAFIPLWSAVLFLVAGCAVQAPKPPPPAPIAEAPKPHKHVTTPAEILTAQPKGVQAIIQGHQPGTRWPTIRLAGTVFYPFDPDLSPIVDCAPLRTTDIQLEAGETITDVALGDAARWMATPASSGASVPHLVLKPQIAGIATNLTIYTTKRIYHLNVRAVGRAMDEVEFYFPDDVLQQMAQAEQAAKQPKTQEDTDSATPSALPQVDPSQLNFAYRVDGAHVLWAPSRVFDDGTHVYLQMPPALAHGEAPALLIDGNGGQQMINYRVVPDGRGGDYYVVDRLFTSAELVSGVGRDQDKVLVTYAGNAR